MLFRSIGLDTEGIPLISAKEGLNIEDVLEDIVQKIPYPEGNSDSPLKALIFDSYYDSYKGVVAMIRIFEGRIAPGMTIRMMSTGRTFEVTEVGYNANGQHKVKALEAGEVGYVVASIKEVGEARVGDTVTDDENPTDEALPRYKKVVPMVFCGIYPAEGCPYAVVREALEKLQVNDAALSFEPETSEALGYGYRCGFLGLLHMDVIQERWRENLIYS